MIQWFGKQVLSKIDDAFERRAMAAGRAMEQYAKSIVPVDTGALKQSIGFMYDRSTRTLHLFAFEHYAMFVEYGTYRMIARPFLRPAIAIFGRVFGVKTSMSVGTSMARRQVPRRILPHIRPQISAANRQHNRGQVRRTALTAFHVGRKGVIARPLKSDLGKLNKIRKAWN